MKNKKNNDNNTKTKQFRLRGKKILLTYYDLNIDSIGEVKDLLLNQLKNKLPKIVQYIIVMNNNNNSFSYSIYFEFNQRIELYRRDSLNLIINEEIYQGDYQTVRKKDLIIRSLLKNKNFIADPELPIIDGEIYFNVKEYLIKLNKKNFLKNDKIIKYLNNISL